MGIKWTQHAGLRVVQIQFDSISEQCRILQQLSILQLVLWLFLHPCLDKDQDLLWNSRTKFALLNLRHQSLFTLAVYNWEVGKKLQWNREKRRLRILRNTLWAHTCHTQLCCNSLAYHRYHTNQQKFLHTKGSLHLLSSHLRVKIFHYWMSSHWV